MDFPLCLAGVTFEEAKKCLARNDKDVIKIYKLSSNLRVPRHVWGRLVGRSVFPSGFAFQTSACLVYAFRDLRGPSVSVRTSVRTDLEFVGRYRELDITEIIALIERSKKDGLYNDV